MAPEHLERPRTDTALTPPCARRATCWASPTPPSGGAAGYGGRRRASGRQQAAWQCLACGGSVVGRGWEAVWAPAHSLSST